MRLFAELVRFEIRYQVRQPAFFITGLILLGISFFATASDAVQLARSGATHVNSPYSVTTTHLVLSIVGMFLAGHFVGRAATRDRTHRMDGLVLSTASPAAARYWGPMLGAFAMCLLVFLGVSIGSVLGSFWPEIASENRGPTRIAPYLWAYAVFVVPNFFFCAAMLYALARAVRSMMGMYLGLVAFFVLYEVATTFFSNPSTRELSALLDPFGFNAFSEAMRYWTADEKNTLLVPFEGVLRLNRLLWPGLAMVVALLVQRFVNERAEIRERRNASSEPEDAREVCAATSARALVSPAHGQQLVARTRIEITQLIGSPAFIILCLLSSFILIGSLIAGDSHYGTRSWPLTRMLSEAIQGSLGLLILIVLTYYTAEAVWREREQGIAELVDSSPVRNAVLYLPKLFALWAVIIGLLLVGVVVAVVFQAASGYTAFEWSVYASTLTLQYLLPAMLVAVLSLLIQVASPNKYVGMLLFGGYVIASLVLPQLGLEHHLWRFSEGPEAIYSDMNGVGHFLPALLWFHLYWSALAMALILLGLVLWPRGDAGRLAARMRQLPSQLGPGGVRAMVLSLAVFVATGAHIYFNTNVLNEYRNADTMSDLRARYEQELARFEAIGQPAISDVEVVIDIYPATRRITATGRYLLQNRTDQPIRELLVGWARGNTVEFSIEGGRVATTYDHVNAARVLLATPLLPGAERRLTFSVERSNRGFRASGVDNRVVGNGTFINNKQLLPRIGYDADQELVDPRERRKRGLPEERRLPLLEDTTQYRRTYLGADVQRVQLDLVVSTVADQIAVAPGTLQKEWQEGQRAYFHYRSDAPMLNYFAVLSGAYDVARSIHDGVVIEIFHHPQHDMNVARMIEATKDALDYFTSQFGPYQHDQLRIIEFPRYERFAQSFANTVPYSEDIGFVADLRDPDVIDYVYSVTAHEVAHQWWGHQVAPANVQGATVLSESLAQYSAYMLLRHRYGDAYLRRFLKWELDRYLQGRGNAVVAEQPLMRAGNEPYIHYQKGGLVLYALQDQLGEGPMHEGLRAFLDQFRFSERRYPTTEDLTAALKAAADPSHHQVVDDAFQRIWLYDLAATSARGVKDASGRYVVTVTVAASKSHFDGRGRSTTVALDESIDIGLLAAHPDAPMHADDVLLVAQHVLRSGETSLTLTSADRPAYVTVDPFLKRIDRDTDDNTVAVTWFD